MSLPRVGLLLLPVLLAACTQAPPSGPPLSPGSEPVDFSFEPAAGCVAAGPSPLRLSVRPGELTISGEVATGDSCPALSARLNLAAGEIRLRLQTEEPRTPCALCPAALPFTARLKDLRPGLYTVRLLADGQEIARQGAHIP